MRHLIRSTAAAVAVLMLPSLTASVSAQSRYRQPPPDVVRIVDAPPLPQVSVSPDRQWLLLSEYPSHPPIEDLAQPMLRLAGSRVNPATSGPWGGTRITGISLQPVASGAAVPVEVPNNPALSGPMWSPDSRSFAFTQQLPNGIELWVADVATRKSRRLAGGLNAVAGAPCQWMPDSSRLLCRLIPADRSATPSAPTIPAGPVVQETSGATGNIWTYQDLLTNAHDEALYDHYFTAQLTLIDARTGAATKVGSPGIFDGVSTSPDGRYVVVTRTVRPYSYLVPGFLFPKEQEIWTTDGQVVRRHAQLPLAENMVNRGVRPGPRNLSWHPSRPATLVWVEALDGGDPRRDAEHRDRVLWLDAPFTGEPRELARTATRFGGIAFGEGSHAFLSEYHQDTYWTRTWILDTEKNSAPRLLWDRSGEDAYGDPGSWAMKPNARGRFVVMQNGDHIYLLGAGATPEGNRPFLDRLDLGTLQTERLWRAGAEHYESIVTLLDDQARTALTRRESRAEPPNFFVRDIRADQLRRLTSFTDPAPELTGIRKQLVHYERADGVPLSGTLYLPPNYREGMRVPVLVWAYPTEYVSRDAAGQVVAAPNTFTFLRGSSHLFLLTQGYAVLDNATMPILGGDTANNTYVEQLVMNGRAAADKLIAMGIADRDRIAIAGHSYGAFMAANMLAHSDIFRAGIARSGAYNRTLTPFGFQNEKRTFWEAPDVYLRMSPFANAHLIDEPLLIIHGDADNNSGTFPIQSERLYHAMKGLGGTARLVMLPHESHGYQARESVLHVLAETIEWLDRHVKNAPPRDVTLQ